jgi:integrase
MAVKVREKPRGSGIWWVMIDHHGRRKAKKIGKDKKLAQKAAQQMEAKLTLGDLDLDKEEQRTPSFKEYSELWLQTYVKPLRRHNTYERYSHILKAHVWPSLKSTPLAEVRRGDVRDLLLKLKRKGLSISSLCLARDVIGGVMNYAVDDEILEVNPVIGIMKRLRLERDRKTLIESLTHEEVSLFLETCLETYPEFHAFFLCAFRTGMRLGELLGLRWPDIDFNSKFIRVERSYKLGRLESTKTGNARRVDMSDQLIETMKHLLTVRKREALKEGRGGPVEIVFHMRGQHMEQNHIRRVFKKVLQKAGIREVRLHDTRHTFASLLLSQGESPVYVKEQLGHSSIQMTVDIYGHLIPSSNRQAVNKLDTPRRSATYPQPAKKEEAQPVEVAPLSLSLVPKRGLEPRQAYAH